MKVNDVVKRVLMEYPDSRGCNDFLYLKVCQKMNANLLDLPFNVVMMHRAECGFPPYESVMRARRKIQRAYPDLRADDTVEEFRELKEEEFKEYARQVMV